MTHDPRKERAITLSDPKPKTEEQIMRNAVGLTQKQISREVIVVDYDPPWHAGNTHLFPQPAILAKMETAAHYDPTLIVHPLKSAGG
jgi:hypothetical protein